MRNARVVLPFCELLEVLVSRNELNSPLLVASLSDDAAALVDSFLFCDDDDCVVGDLTAAAVAELVPLLLMFV